MTDLRFLRAWRIYVVAALVFNAGMLVVDAVTGNPIVVLPIICVTFLAGALVLMTRVIGRRAEQLRPRPDYAAIARMERDVYGETFEHDGAPARTVGVPLTGYSPQRSSYRSMRAAHYCYRHDWGAND